MITKETAIELARQAGFWTTETFKEGVVVGYCERLCNLAVAHAQKDAEPVAWMHPSRAPHLLSHSAYTYGSASVPLYTHQPEDTALLRHVRKALTIASLRCVSEAETCQVVGAIKELNERLGD
jgi:hypothetical protein